MYKDFKFALDKIFLFMLIVSVVVFAMTWKVDVNEHIIHTVEKIDMVVLSGYYFVFGRGIYKARKKINYFKQHWMMAILLVLPFLPITRIMNALHLQKVFNIGSNTLWHILDEIGML